jgi:endonuclease YncB( thermonuclease family)
MQLLMVAIVLVAVCISTSPGAAAEVLWGVANVIDGDTLEIDGKRVRLHGIDAPESGQTCVDGQRREWRCGQRAAFALADRIGRSPLRCEQRDIDRYGRTIAVCFRGSEDLNRWLVSEGLAVAYRRYSMDYAADEDLARQARKGIWAGPFAMPWDYRRGRREAVDHGVTLRRSGCDIKGNINRRGDRIYHTPGDRHYEQTQITANRGERWFCSEQEAEEAGWRRAGR